MEVAEIDVHDDALVRRFWEAGKEGDEYGRPYATFWPLLSATVAFRAANNSMEQHPIAAVGDGQVLGSNQVILPALDNTHVAYMEILVRPAARRRGAESALLDAGLELARAKSRSTVIIEVSMPLVGRSEGRHICSTVSFAPAGSMVALTDMSTSESQPTIGLQGGTLVLPEHRDRLGLACKVANLRRFQTAFPAVRTIHSGNAEENGPMVAINDTLGFRAVERLAEMRRKL